RHQRIETRVATLGDELRHHPPEWLTATYDSAVTDNPAHLKTLTEVAVYRDRYDITDSSRPVGYEPDQPRTQQAQWRRLHARLAQLPTHGQAPDADHDDDMAARLRAIAATRPRRTPTQPKPQQQPPLGRDPDRGRGLDR